MELTAMLVPLALLGALGGLAWWLRTLALRQGRGLDGLRLVQRLALTPRQGVAVIEVNGAHRLVSWGEGGVRDLGAAAPPAPLPPLRPAASTAEGSTAEGSFLETLRRTLGGTAGLGLLAVGCALGILLLATPEPVAAQAGIGPRAPVVTAPSVPTIDLTVGQGPTALNLRGSVGVAVFLGLLTLLPSAIMVMTSFTRFVIVLGFLRTALGTQTSPPTQVLVILALLLTGVVMRPTLEAVQATAITPYMAGELPAVDAYKAALQPLRQFMLANVRSQDVVLFAELANQADVSRPEELGTIPLTAAFLTSELRTAFLMGAMLFIPFLVIDLIVSSVLMSLGMFMLPPVMVSLPFKLLVFVLADGWALVVRSLVASYHAVPVVP